MAASLAALAGAPSNVPDDPLIRWQVSFLGEPGSHEILRSWGRPSVERVVLASGVAPDLPRAWQITTGSPSVIVAVLDDGFFYQHEDIAPNVWRNPGESGPDAFGRPREINRVDDDGNGFVDDVVGWDFVFEDPDPDVYAFDGMDRSRIQPYEHAMPALGIIGARGNNGIGIAGINWQVSLMLLRIGVQGTPRGQRDLERPGRAARAIRFAADNGARIINWSGFVDSNDESALRLLREAIGYASGKGVLLVTGAGNDKLNIDDDANCLYPECFDLPNQIRVAEVALDGSLVTYETRGQVRGSNYGVKRVEVAAIGMNFSTTVIHGRSGYGTHGGTSNAAPVVAGVAALMLAVCPELDAVGLRSLLVRTVTKRGDLHSTIGSGGIVNAARAVQAARAYVRPAVSTTAR